MVHDIEEDIFAAKEEESILAKYDSIPEEVSEYERFMARCDRGQIPQTEKIKVKVKPHVPLSELAAPLLQKWGK